MKDRYILGISAFYHDSAACLLKDGRIFAAAQEERFTRKKHDHRFPSNAVEYCLNEGGITADELDNVFGPVARTSLAGETAKGFKKGAEAVAGQRTVVGAAIEAGAAGVERLRGINEANAFKSITELIGLTHEFKNQEVPDFD